MLAKYFDDVRQASTSTIFKSRLKTVLFSCAYDRKGFILHFYPC
uniref:Uncharacterized protein n=1 Tax=Periophthalmus magnuspinnatus TaxID=409849 RepID=A0A3B4B6F6_9GOBI